MVSVPSGRLKPLGSSMANGAFGRCSVSACGDRRRHALGGQAVPDRRQLARARVPSRSSWRCWSAGVGQAVGAGEVAVEIVEAAVLGVDHDHVLDLVDAGRVRRVAAVSAAASSSRREPRPDAPRRRYAGSCFRIGPPSIGIGQPAVIARLLVGICNRGTLTNVRLPYRLTRTDRQDAAEPRRASRGEAHAWSRDRCRVVGVLIGLGVHRSGAGAHRCPWRPSHGPAMAATLSRAEARRQAARLAALGREAVLRSARSRPPASMACASCHDPAHAFGPPNALPVQLGGGDLRQPGLRAVPSLSYLQAVPPFTEHFFDSEDDADESVDNGPTGGLTWDGRADRGHEPGARSRCCRPSRWRTRARTRSSPRARGRLRRRPAGDLRRRRSSTDRGAASTRPAQGARGLRAGLADVLSLHQQVRRLPRRQGDARAAGGARAGAVRGPGQGQLRGLPHQPARQRRHPAAVHRLRPDRARRAAQPGDPGQRRPGAISTSGCAARCAPTCRAASTIAACSARRRCATSPRARPSSTTASIHDAAQGGAVLCQRDTNPERWYPRKPDGSVAQVRRPAARVYHANLNDDPPFDRQPGEPPALTEARDRRRRRVPADADRRLRRHRRLSLVFKAFRAALWPRSGLACHGPP